MKYRKILIILIGSLLLREWVVNASFLSKLFGGLSSDSKSDAEKPWVVKTGKQQPYSVAFSPNGRLVAVTTGREVIADRSGDKISVYTVNENNGTFTPVPGSPFVTGKWPRSVAFSPSGKFAAVTNTWDNAVSVYTVDAISGLFTPLPNSPFATGLAPAVVAFSPNGQFAVVSNQSDNTLNIYKVDAKSGSFISNPNPPIATGLHPYSVTFSPNGQFVALVNRGGETGNVYKVDAHAGRLVPLQDTSFATGRLPNSIAFSPNGKFAAVVNERDNTVSVYTVDAKSGSFTPIQDPPFATGKAPFSIVFFPTGQFAAVTNGRDNTISVYSVDANTGKFIQVQGSPFATGKTPTSVAFSPTSEIAAVANENDNTLWIYEVDQHTGKFTPITGGLLPAFQRKEELKKTKKSFEEFGEQKHTTEEGEWAGLGGTIPGPVDLIMSEYLVGPVAAPTVTPSQKNMKEETLQKAIAQTQQDRLQVELNKTLLFAAIQAGDVKAVQENLTPFTINSINEQRRTPLMEAVLHENKNLVERLLAYEGIAQETSLHKEPITVNTTIGDAEGDTALMLAIRHKKFELAVIIENNMNPSEFALKNKEGKTAFDLLKEKKPSEYDKWYDILYEILK